LPTTGSLPHAGQVCGEVHYAGSLPLPQPGYVSIAETTINADCSTTTTAVRVAPLSQLEPGVSQTEPSASSQVEGGVGGGAGNESSPPTASASAPVWSTEATVHQRLWDCCGILLNAFYTDVKWGFTGRAVSWYTGTDYERHHTEWPFPGWYPLAHRICCGNQAGRWAVSISGHIEFGYRGVFDPTGTWYYNTYDNLLIAYGNGGAACRYAYSFRHAFRGWHTQDWCGYDTWRR